MAAQQKLSTTDRLASWGMRVNENCVLCSYGSLLLSGFLFGQGSLTLGFHVV